MKLYQSLFVLCSILTACGTTVNTTTVSYPEQSVLDILVSQENDYRQSVGQAPLTKGLVCSLYTVPNTTTSIIGASLTGIGSFSYHLAFNQQAGPSADGNSILPSALQKTYQTWYIIKCSGLLVVTDDNYHQFELTSDDGANLYIDGLLINNDGIHASQTKSAIRFLKYGFHSFELDFLQGGGQQSLILNEDGTPLLSNTFYH